jgi:hypothetical protein
MVPREPPPSCRHTANPAWAPAGLSPAPAANGRSTLERFGALAQLGERRLCKPEVAGSIPARSTENPLETAGFLLPVFCSSCSMLAFGNGFGNGRANSAGTGGTLRKDG